MSVTQAESIETIILADRKPPGVIANLRRLYKYRELFLTLTVRDLKVRYKQAALGAAWAVVRPLLLMFVFTVVFSRLLNVPSDDVPYPIFSFCAVLPWTFFATAVSLASQSMVANMNLVTKISFPKEVIPFASIAACLVDLLVGSSIFVIMMVYYVMTMGIGIRLTVHALWTPYLILVQIVFLAGIALVAAAANVFYRDIRHVVPVGVQLWMYASPVIYPATKILENYPRFYGFYMLNPMAVIIDSYRKVLLYGKPPNLTYLALATGIAICSFLCGYTYFKRVEPKFADLI